MGLGHMIIRDIERSSRRAAAERRRRHAAAVRAHNAAIRNAERARREADRARVAHARAAEAQRKAAEKEAARLYLESRLAETDEMNAALAANYDDIDTILEWTLGYDDFVDLRTLKLVTAHPPFEPGDLGTATAVPHLTQPVQPTWTEPAPPTGMAAAFGGKKRHALARNAAYAAYEEEVKKWQETVRDRHAAHQVEVERHKVAEAERVKRLAAAQAVYQQECADRDALTAMHNQKIDEFIGDFRAGKQSAVEDYVQLVINNSVYPETFGIERIHSFDATTGCLRLTVGVPEPSTLPKLKGHRYVKSTDTIIATDLPMTQRKARYANAVHQVALRSIHEIFEADREGIITRVALTVDVGRLSPAHGKYERVPLVFATVARQQFEKIDLKHVVPATALEHLGASVSTSPWDSKAAKATLAE